MQQICVYHQLVKLVMGLSGAWAQASPTSRPGWSRWAPCGAASPQGPRLLGHVLSGHNSSSSPNWDQTELKLRQPHRCTRARQGLAASPSLCPPSTCGRLQPLSSAALLLPGPGSRNSSPGHSSGLRDSLPVSDLYSEVRSILLSA